MRYVFREGARLPARLDPVKVAGELTKIHERNGHLEPDAVIESARSKRSPLHDAFEWDDEQAAIEYRRDQARHLIRAVRIETDDGPDAPAFIHVPSSRGFGYYATPEVLSRDRLAFDRAMDEARRNLAGAERAIADLIRLDGSDRYAISRDRVHEAREALA